VLVLRVGDKLPFRAGSTRVDTVMRAFKPDDEDVPLLHALGEGVADDSRATRTWVTRATACLVAGLLVAAGVVGASSPSARASLGLEQVLTPAERVVGDPVVTGVELVPPEKKDKEKEPKPFTAMEGMFAYEGWTQSLFEETQDDRPLLQQLPKYGASVDWSQIMAALNSGIGKSGRRKLFLFIRHGKATHNEWGKLQHHAHDGEDIPCDFKTPGDLVDPDLTDLGRSDTLKYVRDVFRDGLGAAIHKKAKVFSSPLARCMETTLRMLTSQTGLRVAGDKVTVSELLRERIDARVPFELRRPVSFVPASVIAAEAAAEAAKNGTAALSGQGGARGPGGMCWEPSKGLTGHEGRCCVHDGLLEKFGDYGVFEINVATPSFLNVEVSVQDADLDYADRPKDDETGEPIAHHVKQYKYVGASCGLTEVANRGWQECSGPEMLGLLAEDDLALGSKEESEYALVERVRTWFSSVYDNVEENVVIAVTHSDWIKLALRELDIEKPWVVPKNGEIFPIIIEDTRTSVPGWIEKREARERRVKSATDIGGVVDLTPGDGLGAHENVLDLLKISDEAAKQAAATAAAAERAAAVEREAAEAAKAAADHARVAEIAAQRAIAEAYHADAAATAKTNAGTR
jgi:broad specificity phosphatase PhoE